MKRLFRKDNRIARFIAMWLVFIMALTPLYQHSGLKNPTKAEDNTPITINHTVSVDVGGKVISKTENITDDTTTPVTKTVSYKVAAIDVPAEDDVPEIHYYDRSTWDVTFNIGQSVTGEMTYTDISTDKYSAIGTKVTSLSAIQPELTSAPTEATTVTDGDYYAIYVKVDDDAFTEDANTTVSNTVWALQAVYKITAHTTLRLGNLWRNADPDSDKTGLVAKACLNVSGTMGGNMESGKDILVGDYKLYYKKTDSNVFDASYMTAENELTSSTVVGDAEGDSGTYYAWIAYSFDAVSYTVYDSESNDKIVIDNVAPKLETENGVFPIIRNGDDSNNNTNKMNKDNDGIYYLSKNRYGYGLYLSVIEDNHPDTYYTVKATNIDDETDVKTFTTTKAGKYCSVGNIVDGLTPGKTYKYTIELVDKAGNGGEVELYSVVVKYVDPTLKITGSVTDGNSTPVEFSGNSGNDPYKNVTLPDTETNVRQTVTATITSGYQITSVKVDAQDGNNNNQAINLYDKTAAAQNASKSGGVYTYDLTFTLPENEGTDQKYNSILLTVTDANNETVNVNFASLVYDYQKPTLTADGIYKWEKDENDNWIWKKVERDNGTLVISTDPANTDEYKFVFTATDPATGTGMNRVDYYYSQDAGATAIGSLDVDGNTYYKEFSNSELLTAMNGQPSLTFSAKAFDNVDNSSDFVAAPLKIVAPSMQLSAEAVLYKVVDGEMVAVNLNESHESNNQYILRVTASSGYNINKMLVKNGEGTTVTELTTINQQLDIDDQRMHVMTGTEKYVDIILPVGTTVNTILTDLDLVVGDDGGINPEKTLDIGTLLFDKTNPELFEGTYNGVDALSPFGIDDKWYTESPDVAGTIMPGPQLASDPESAIDVDTISYSIANKVGGDVTDVKDKNMISGRDNMGFFTISVPESKTAEGTKLSIKASDKAGNILDTTSTPIVKYVDLHDPYVTELKINGASSNAVPFGKKVTVTANVNDNLSLKKATVEVVEILDDGTTGKVYTMEPAEYAVTDALNMDENAASVSRSVAYSVELPDGEYRANVKAFDKAGRESAVTSTAFTVDSTAPVVTADISAGTVGKNDTFYKSNVTVKFTSNEKHTVKHTITDNGSVVTDKVTWKYNPETKVMEGTYEVTTDGAHTVKINAEDGTGNEAAGDQVYFIKDTKAPTISSILNGAIVYNESDGVRVFTADTTLAFSETDDNKDLERFYYQMTKKVPDENPVVGKSAPTNYRSFTYSEEAEYTVKVYSVDMANNTSATRTVQFRIDKTAPNISIGGIASGGTSSNPVTVSLNMQELYWSDATGTVEIYMKSGEGFGEELVEEITYTPTGRNSVMTRSFAESGVYRIEFNAQDSAGHTATTSSTFTIDTEVPVVTLEGVSNFDVTDKDVVISSTITDKFYASKKVTITGTVTDETGKVTPLTIDNYSPTANPTTINETFSADGIYDLTITCVDIAGNSDSKSVHFTIDKTNPVIGDLSDFEDKILTSFDWDKDLDELVSDLTVCDVHMYLNGQEYNGEDAVEDGSYVLLITAEDELGHKVEKEVKFTLDTKAPVFIVTGVEDKESKIEPYNITVSLQLEEDTLTSVTLNGKVVTITNNQVTFDVTEIGEYKLCMEAVDEAGNVSSAEYEFELEAEKEFNFWIIIGIAAALLLLIIIIILKKRKKDQ